MSRVEREQFELLLAAHAGRTLTVDEDVRLREFAATDAAFADKLSCIDDVHAAFDAEHALFAEMCTPVSAVEESDEGFARLAQVAVSAEDGLRAQLRFAPLRTELAGMTGHRSLSRRIALAAAAVAALVVVALLLTRGDGNPKLLPGDPGDRVLGGTTRILMQAELRVDRPSLSWHAVVGASRYDARIEDSNGQLVLSRDPAQAASTSWGLDAAQFRSLAEHADASKGLRLRIIARDGAGLAVGTTGDLPLRLVD